MNVYSCDTLEQVMTIQLMMDVLFAIHMVIFEGNEEAAGAATDVALANFSINWWVEH